MGRKKLEGVAKIVSFRLYQEDINYIELVAKEKNISKSEALRLLVKRGLFSMAEDI